MWKEYINVKVSYGKFLFLFLKSFLRWLFRKTIACVEKCERIRQYAGILTFSTRVDKRFLVCLGFVCVDKTDHIYVCISRCCFLK